MADDLKKKLVQYGDKVLFGIFLVVLAATAALTLMGGGGGSGTDSWTVGQWKPDEKTVAGRITDVANKIDEGGIPSGYAAGGFATDPDEINPRKGEVACEYCGYIMPENVLRCPSCGTWRKNDDDKDGMPNDWEDRYKPTLDRYTPDANKDPDGDGFSNYKEYLGGSDPTDPKSIPSPFRITNQFRKQVDILFQGYTIKEGGSSDEIDAKYWVILLNYGRNTRSKLVPLGGYFRGYQLWPLEKKTVQRTPGGGIPPLRRGGVPPHHPAPRPGPHPAREEQVGPDQRELRGPAGHSGQGQRQGLQGTNRRRRDVGQRHAVRDRRDARRNGHLTGKRRGNLHALLRPHHGEQRRRAMKTTLVAFAIGLGLALTLWSGAAPAGTEPAPAPTVSTEQIQELAAEYYDQAVKAYNAGQLEAARRQLRAALKLDPTLTKAKSMLALVEEKLNVPPAVLLEEKLGTRIGTVQVDWASLRDVVEYLAREADVNIVFDASALQVLGAGADEPAEAEEPPLSCSTPRANCPRWNRPGLPSHRPSRAET